MAPTVAPTTQPIQVSWGPCHKPHKEEDCFGKVESRTSTINGRVLKGQECAWCNGAPCSDANGNKCEPVDWLCDHHKEAKFVTASGRSACPAEASTAAPTSVWTQQTSTQCGSTTAENTAANAAGVEQHSPNRHDNSHLKDFNAGTISLSACKARCMETKYCRGIERTSNAATDSDTASCWLMYSGTDGGSWSGSCWYFQIGGSIPTITAGSGNDILEREA